MTDEQIEAIVISDADGTLYAVPRPILEQWRLSDETARAIRDSNDVSGYIIVIGGFQSLGTAQFTFPGGLSALSKQWGDGTLGATLQLRPV